MKAFACMFLVACSADVFTYQRFDGVRDSCTAEACSVADAETKEGATVEDARENDARVEDAKSEAKPDASTCGADGGACSGGTCCNGLHCVSGKCSACKPDGMIAIMASECCNPQSFANAACGGVKTCAAPNYDKCGPSNNGLACCGDAQCKQNGQIWVCTCGGVDSPCHIGNDFECCSNACVNGWCK